MINYDSNLCFSGNTTVQEVRLTFGRWEYRKVIETEVGGNCLGLNVIKAAVENAYDSLIETKNKNNKFRIMEGIVLEDRNGNSLECFDIENEGCQWLEDMLLSAEIISIIPSKEGENN
jgi:hypothetical protein